MRYQVKYITDKDYWGDLRTKLTIFIDDKEVSSYRDGGEPEDNCFGRDYCWIEKELRKAYELGLKHGKESK